MKIIEEIVKEQMEKHWHKWYAKNCLPRSFFSLFHIYEPPPPRYVSKEEADKEIKKLMVL